MIAAAVDRAIGYLLGSIPFGIVITRALGLGDLRQIGSGNIGATNVLRTGNKGAALATLLLDSGKGAIAVLLARWLGGAGRGAGGGGGRVPGPHVPGLAGVPRRQGGRHVSRHVLALFWPVGLIACALWLARQRSRASPRCRR